MAKGAVSEFFSKLRTISFCLFTVLLVELAIFIQSLSCYTWRRFHKRATGATANNTTLLALIDARHPAIRYNGSSGSDGELKECAVCLMRLEEGDEMRELQCKHDFHKKCLDQWLEKEQVTCPLCRRYVLGEEEMFQVRNQLRSEYEFDRDGARLAVMLYGLQGLAYI